MDNMPSVTTTAAPAVPPSPATPVQTQLPPLSASSVVPHLFGRYGVFIVSGIVVALVAVLTIVVSAMPQTEDGLVQGETQNVEQFSLFPYQLALEFYYVEHVTYPSTLQEVLLTDRSLTAEQRTELGTLAYEVTPDGSMYTLCTSSSEDVEPICVSRGGEPEPEDGILLEQL